MFVSILLFLSFLLPDLKNSSDYRNLLTYEPEELIFRDFSLIAYAKVYFNDPISYDYHLYECIKPAYYRRYYSSKYEYNLLFSGEQKVIGSEGAKSIYFISSLIGTGKYYPVNDLMFTSLSIDLNPAFYRDKEDSWDSRITGEIQMGFGFGRMIPISPMDKAIKVQKELKKLRVITDSFSDEVLKGIADLISRKENYNDPRDFWREIERIIVSSGFLDGERLGAVPTIRLNEIFESNIPWNWNLPERTSFVYDFGKLYFRSIHKNLFGGRERGFEGEIYIGDRYLSIESNSNKIFLGGRFDYAYPLNSRLQISFNSISEFYTGDTLKWRKANVGTELTYEVFRQLFNRFSLKYNGLNPYITWIVSYGIDYLIEYKMILTVDFSLVYSERENDLRGNFSIGLNYLFF